MNREDCKVGVEVYTDDGPTYRYKVVELPDNSDIVKVEPTKNSHGEMDAFHLDDLFLYDPELMKKIGADMQAKIDEARDAFQKAFDALRKVQQYESEDNQYFSTYDMEELKLISLDELESTVERGGWNRSSLWC